MFLAALSMLAACSGGGSADDAPGFDLRLGETCATAAECGDSECLGDVCSLSCVDSADCPQFAVCTELPEGGRGCLWFCSEDADCPTTTSVCVGSGFGVCRE